MRGSRPRRFGPAAAALLGGCGDNQSVLNPKGPEALQLAHLSWLLFAFGTIVLLLVVLATAVAIRGPQCRQLVRVEADPRKTIAETSEADNVHELSCASLSRR